MIAHGDLRICTGQHGRADARRPSCGVDGRRSRARVSRDGERSQDRPAGAGEGATRPRGWRHFACARLDRLARSTRDLLNILDTIAKAGAGFRSLGDAWADTTTPHGRLMLTVLGGLAEFERELIRARTGEGRVRAKARGVHMGRPPKLTPAQRREEACRRSPGAGDAGRPRAPVQRQQEHDFTSGGDYMKLKEFQVTIPRSVIDFRTGKSWGHHVLGRQKRVRKDGAIESALYTQPDPARKTILSVSRTTIRE